MHVRKEIRYLKDYRHFFREENNRDSSMDKSWLDFHIPSVKTLYDELVNESRFELITKLSIIAIKRSLQAAGVSQNFFKQYESRKLTDKLFTYSFRLPDKLDTVRREKLFNALCLLRQTELSEADLKLNDGSLKLHLSSIENYAFKQIQCKSVLPEHYRATCIYQLIISDLYFHSQICKGFNPDENLISDYLSIHTVDVVDTDWNCKYALGVRIINILREMTCDRYAAASLQWSFDQCIDYDDLQMPRGVLATLPLTKCAHLSYRPMKYLFPELTAYSHKYFSLIQYRYLLDLKKLFFAKSCLPELTRVEDEMQRWQEFRNMPDVMKCEAVADAIYQIVAKENYQWTDVFWQEFFIAGQKKYRWSVFNNNVEAILPDRELMMSIQNTLIQTSKGALNNQSVNRMNQYALSDSNYKHGYYIAITAEALRKCSVRDLLPHDKSYLYGTKNFSLFKLLLCNQSFFATNTVEEWVSYSHTEGFQEVSSFVWKLDSWPLIKQLFQMQQDPETQPFFALPKDLISIILDKLITFCQQNKADEKRAVIQF